MEGMRNIESLSDVWNDDFEEMYKILLIILFGALLEDYLWEQVCTLCGNRGVLDN